MFSHLPKVMVYVRHPQCMHNGGHDRYDEAIRQGISNRDSELTTLGHQQACLTTAFLRETFTFDRMFASDFLRTQAIPKRLGGPCVIDSRLGERWHGQLHELGSYYFVDHPHDRKRFYEDIYNFQAVGGETCPMVEARLTDFLSDAQLFAGCDTILLSGHGVSGLCLRKLLTKASVRDWKDWYSTNPLHNGSVTVYKRVGDEYKVTLYNYNPSAGLLPQTGEEAA